MNRRVTPPKLAGVAWGFFGLARKVNKVSESRETASFAACSCAVQAHFCGFTTQKCVWQNHHATQVTPKWVTSPNWGPPTPCNQALIWRNSALLHTARAYTICFNFINEMWYWVLSLVKTLERCFFLFSQWHGRLGRKIREFPTGVKPFHSIPFHSIPFHPIPSHHITFHSTPLHSALFYSVLP